MLSCSRGHEVWLPVQAALLPNVSVGSGTGPGCFTHLKGIQTTTAQLWWWETIMTFLLVSVGHPSRFPDKALADHSS
jgi:hypothetical protein